MTDPEFERRWRLAALADPGHATYPEAVPGYRRRAAAARTRPAEGPRTRRADLDAHRAAEAVEPITRTDHDTGGMIVHWPPLDARPAATWPTPDDVRQAVAEIDAAVQAVTDLARVDAPVTVAEIRTEIEREADDEAELIASLAGPAKLATDDAVHALADTIARHDTRRARRWWDPRRWWR